jgi:hypothetical protein
MAMSLTLKLGTTEVLDDVLPVRRVIVAAQIRLQATTENLQGSTLSDTVGSNETKDLPRPGHRQTVQLEAVGTISVGDLALEVCGQVDDSDGVEGALLGADTATNAQRFGNEGETRIGLHLNAELAATNDRARLLAFLTTFAWTTLSKK